jgi:hypothetical protein
MTSKSVRVRGAVLVAAMAAFTISAMASPITFPPLPPTVPHVTV